MCPYVALRRPLWFDSHPPLPSRATPVNARLQDWGQDIDPMGKSWESTLERATVSRPHVSLHCPGIHRYSHTHQFTRINCVIPTLSSDRERPQVAGLDPSSDIGASRKQTVCMGNAGWAGQGILG